MFTTVIENTTTPAAISFAGEQRVVSPAGSLFYNAFDAGLNTSYWKTPVAGGGGVAAISEAADTRLGTGTTANGFSTLESVPTFQPVSPGWLQVSFANNLPFPYVANTYFFMGLGTQPGTPTASAPLTDAAGFEVAIGGKMFAVCYAGGTRNLIADLSNTGNNTQPLDSNPHLYTIYYRGDHITWCIDGFDAVVAQTFSGVPGPNVNTLPLKLVAIAGPVAPLSNGQLQCNVGFVGDTTNHATQLSDGTLLWQKAAVDSSGNLSVKGTVTVNPSGTQTVTGTVTASVSNFPATQTITGTITGTVSAAISNFPATQTITGSTTLIPASTTLVTAGTVANTVIKATPGTFYGCFASSVGAGGGLIYDNATTNTGTPVGSAPTAVGFDTGIPAAGVKCVNGITLAGGATNAALTVFWL